MNERKGLEMKLRKYPATREEEHCSPGKHLGLYSYWGGAEGERGCHSRIQSRRVKGLVSF